MRNSCKCDAIRRLPLKQITTENNGEGARNFTLMYNAASHHRQKDHDHDNLWSVFKLFKVIDLGVIKI